MILDKPSPNQGARPPGVEPDLLVLHGTVGSDAGDLAWLSNAESKVSYHYLIQRDGTVYRLVPEARKAWHAGVSSWEGRDNCNAYSIGIGLSNLGPKGSQEFEPFTREQYKAAGWLCADIMERYGIPFERVVGHQHISPGRKTDPWLHFQWTRLVADILEAERDLARRGYAA